MGVCPGLAVLAAGPCLASAGAITATVSPCFSSSPAPRRCRSCLGAETTIKMRGPREMLGCVCWEAYLPFFCPWQDGEADHSGYAGELGFRVSTRPRAFLPVLLPCHLPLPATLCNSLGTSAGIGPLGICTHMYLLLRQLNGSWHPLSYGILLTNL